MVMVMAMKIISTTMRGTRKTQQSITDKKG
jgi:hypothetical protein